MRPASAAAPARAPRAAENSACVRANCLQGTFYMCGRRNTEPSRRRLVCYQNGARRAQTSHAAYERTTASQLSGLLAAVLLYQLNNTPRLKPPKRSQRARKQPASAGQPIHPSYTRQPQHKTMAEEKKSRACHYLQPQEWWFEDKTPIACAGA